jgi:hypothetical protein
MPSSVVLEGVVSALLPSVLTVPAGSPPARWILPDDRRLFELRAYRRPRQGFGPAMAKLLARSGVSPLMEWRGPELVWLIPFESLEARAAAWSRVNADPEWAAWSSGFASYGFSVYRVKARL